MITQTAGSELHNREAEFLVRCQKYLNSDDFERVNKALNFAKKKHDNSFRRSGKPFVKHPVETALRLTQLKIDSATIEAALLHDVLEDTPTTSSELEKEFGSEVTRLVESVTKLESVKIKKGWFPFSNIASDKIPLFERQIETLRKMLVSMAGDIRVILIKFADRINNLETLQYLEAAKRERIAKEAIEIYSPIAERLGMGEWSGVIEDLAFPFLYPDEYRKLRQTFDPIFAEKEKYLKPIISQTRQTLMENSVKGEIRYRVKKWYSLYRKMKRYGGNAFKIYDLVAVRIIVESIEDCYKVLGIIHKNWKPLIGRIKDFIALPKPNGYRSIHTTVFCGKEKIVEFQIRTWEMHHEAEFGVAAHWIYSEGKTSNFLGKDNIKWLLDFDMGKDQISSRELADSFKMDLFQDRIFVFTPTGDVRDLPLGATPVDFAYSIHTDLGNHTGGAKINGKITQLSQKLQNGDIVEILKNKNAKPRRDWLGFVKTHLARSQIKRYAASGNPIVEFIRGRRG